MQRPTVSQLPKAVHVVRKRERIGRLTPTEARRPIRDGGEWEKGGQKSETSKQAPTRKTEAAVDRRQNNGTLRQCPSGIAQRPPEHSHKDSVRSSAVGKQLKQTKSNSLSLSLAQLHLPTLDLFWANFFVRVQLTSLLLISPGLCWSERDSQVGYRKRQLIASVVQGRCV